MKRYGYLESGKGKALLALFLTASLLLCRDAQPSESIWGIVMAQFLLAGMVGAMGLGFLASNWRERKELFRDQRMKFLRAAALVMVVPFLVKRDWQLMYFSILFCLAYAVFLTYFSTCREISKYYVLILTVLGAYSLLTSYLLRLLPDSHPGLIPVFKNGINVEFYNFGLSYVSISYVRNRNFGIFREPGVYQYFLLLGLYLNNDVVSWRDKRWQYAVNGILGVTMLSTFATGGVIEMILLFVFFFFDKKLYRSKKARMVTYGVILAGIATVTAIVARKGTLYNEFYDMLIGKFSPGQDSGPDRIHSILINLALFLKSPLIGNGIYKVLHAVENNTSSTTILLAILGICGGMLHVISWVALTWRKNRGFVMNALLLVILFMSFNTQNLVADVFLWLMPIMALVERLPQRKECGGYETRDLA